MKYVFKIFTCTAIVICILNVASCGKASDPKPIDGSGYPHSYPRY